MFRAVGRSLTGTHTRSGGSGPRSWQIECPDSEECNKVAVGIAFRSIEGHEIPVLPLVEDGKPRAVIGFCNHRGCGRRPGANVEIAPVYINNTLTDGPLRSQEGDSKVFGERQDNGSGNFIQMGFDPGGVILIIVVAQFNEYRWGAGLAHLPYRCGGLCTNPVGQGIDCFQIFHHDLCRPCRWSCPDNRTQ